MFEEKIEKKDLPNLSDFIHRLDFFRNLRPEFLEDLASSFTKLSLNGGEILFQEGDKEKAVYILLEGRLRVYVKEINQNTKKQVPIAEISIGQVIGEIAFLSDAARTATVVAVRDSVMLKLNEKTLKRLELYHAPEMLEIAKIAIKRLLDNKKPQQMGEKNSVITIVPAGDATNYKKLAEMLCDSFNKYSSPILVDKHSCEAHFKNSDASNFIDLSSLPITKWFHSLENQFTTTILIADRQLNPWTELCIRQADRILFVAEDFNDSSLNPIEQKYFSTDFNFLPTMDLVLLHNDNIIRHSDSWLNTRPVSNYHHVRLNKSKDISRLIRLLNGQGFGLVLNGGGARGLSHIGALKALDELGIPVDFIAGNSIGSLIGACYAQGMEVSELIEITKYCISKFRKEFTLPVLALMTGKSISEVCKIIGGDKLIEDLPISFFCIASNLTKAEPVIHAKGTLWKAIRSSISIPGIFPPFYDEKGNALVDGGIINNMPVDILRKKMFGGKILAINCHPYSGDYHNMEMFSNETWISGWKLFLKRCLKRSPKELEYDNIFNIILSSMHLGSIGHEKLMANEADYCIQFDTSRYGLLEFEAVDEIIEEGYRESMDKFPDLLRKQI